MIEAAQRYRRILAIDPGHYPEVHGNLGLALLQQGKLDEAATSYRKALDLRPNEVEGLLNLGNILGDLGKAEEAIGCHPQGPRVQAGLCGGSQQPGRPRSAAWAGFDEAVGSYRRALEIRPDFVMALDNLASALHGTGQLGGRIGRR